MPSASGSWTGWGWRVAVVTAANVNDAMMLQAMLDDVPSVLTPSGRRRHRPGKLHGEGLRQRSQPRLSAAAGDPAADRPAWGGILDAARAAAVEGGTVVVVVELLAAAGVRWDGDSERWFAFVLVACAVIRFNPHHPALPGQSLTRPGAGRAHLGTVSPGCR